MTSQVVTMKEHQQQPQILTPDFARINLPRAYAQKIKDIESRYETELSKLKKELDQYKQRKNASHVWKPLNLIGLGIDEAKAPREDDILTDEQLLKVVTDQQAALNIILDLKWENKAITKKYRTAMLSASENADLVKQFQQMLAECQTETERTFSELVSQRGAAEQPPSAPAAQKDYQKRKFCFRCKFIQHKSLAEATTAVEIEAARSTRPSLPNNVSAANLKSVIVQLRKACDEAKTRVSEWKKCADTLQAEQVQTQKRADYWMTKFLETNTPEAKAVNLQLRFQGDQVAAMQSVITRPECQFESLEETLKASRFWLRPLNRLSSTWTTKKSAAGGGTGPRQHSGISRRLTSAISSPNLRLSAGFPGVAKNTRSPGSVTSSCSGDSNGCSGSGSNSDTTTTTIYTQGLATPIDSPVLYQCPRE